MKEFAQSGVANQFWDQWRASDGDKRHHTVLRFASGGDVTPLKLLIDVALRSSTAQELLGEESTDKTLDDLGLLASALDLTPTDDEFLTFLKALQAEQLPDADELEGLVIRSLAPFGPEAATVSQRLIRLVARSKHAGSSARSSFDQSSLLAALRAEGVSDDLLIGAGLAKANRPQDASLSGVSIVRLRYVKSFRHFPAFTVSTSIGQSLRTFPRSLCH